MLLIKSLSFHKTAQIYFVIYTSSSAIIMTAENLYIYIRVSKKVCSLNGPTSQSGLFFFNQAVLSHKYFYKTYTFIC
ncbi:hypothetical protein CHCC20335_0845 [Bacillus paralicheniformis]|nr:hypothetical protein CHCC20335_0845 [Bacillus paralicheniformis]